MKKKLYGVCMVLFLFASSIQPAFAAKSGNQEPVSVRIQSPASIDASPVYEGDIEIVVKNLTAQTLTDLGCYLTIVDVGRKQTYPVDEFGENAYQTRDIASLAPGEEITIKIPVRVLYVGEFRFTGSVIDYDSNIVVTGDALEVYMTAISNLNKTLVLGVSAVVPVVVLSAVLLLAMKKKKKSK